MKRQGPIITLAAGLVVAAVLMVMNLSVTKNDEPDAANAAVTGVNAASATAGATTAPAAEATTPPGKAQITYAGKVNGGAATIAIAVKDAKAVAYLCDGERVEAWLQGTATNGELSLTGAGKARLTGTFGNGVARGDVAVAGRKWGFSATVVKKPSGLYRATANVRGAQVVGGWIVDANGDQVGLLVVDGTSQPAPPLDPTTNNATVDGTQITAEPVDGSGL